ncbi:MAG: Hint domain-containing protein [Pseudomonadota bacterium]
MARISELHYSNAFARDSGVEEFLEVALKPGDDPGDFTVSFYNADGSVGIEIPLDHPDVQVSIDAENGEYIYVVSAEDFPIKLTDPDGNGSNNYEAFSLTDTSGPTPDVLDFYDIGGGTQNIQATDGLAAGEVSDNIPVLVNPNQTTTSIQFNQPDPATVTYEALSPGDTGLACFAAGTQVETPAGPRPIEALRAGDLVVTLDSGPRAILWVGSGSVPGDAAHAPIRIKAGTLGATRDVRVSPQHRVLIEGWESELLFGQSQIFVPAISLVNGKTVTQEPCAEITYFHILLEEHEVLTTSGLRSESLFAGCETHGNPAAFEEAAALIPELRARAQAAELARPAVSAREARALKLA